MQKLRVIKSEQKVCVLPRSLRAGLDGDFFIPVLSAAFAVVLHWADMMPGHGMDLPVPRGTSILMLAAKRQTHVCVTCSVSPSSSYFRTMVSFSPAVDVRPPDGFSKASFYFTWWAEINIKSHLASLLQRTHENHYLEGGGFQGTIITRSVVACVLAGRLTPFQIGNQNSWIKLWIRRRCAEGMRSTFQLCVRCETRF